MDRIDAAKFRMLADLIGPASDHETAMDFCRNRASWLAVQLDSRAFAYDDDSQGCEIVCLTVERNLRGREDATAAQRMIFGYFADLFCTVAGTIRLRHVERASQPN